MDTINGFNKKSWEYDNSCNRYLMSNDYLDRISMYELNRAREEFDSDNLLYTYSLLSFYDEKKSKLEAHKDNNACTYTFDICLYQNEPWPIVVEDKEYILKPNEALCFYGEDQLHYRPDFKDGNKVLMMFMHWAEKDHWFFHADNRKVKM